MHGNLQLINCEVQDEFYINIGLHTGSTVHSVSHILIFYSALGSLL